MPHVTRFIAECLAPYDTAQLDWIKLLPLNRRELLHGCCHFPWTPGADDSGSAHGYRIRASVNVLHPPPYVYSHWGRVASDSNARGWVSAEIDYHFADLEECAVHTLAHECFHFLANSGQVGERDTEANANWWADAWLDDFRVRAVAALTV